MHRFLSRPIDRLICTFDYILVCRYEAAGLVGGEEYNNGGENNNKPPIHTSKHWHQVNNNFFPP